MKKDLLRGLYFSEISFNIKLPHDKLKEQKMINTNIYNKNSEVKQLQDKIFNITPKRFYPLIRRKFLDCQSDIFQLAEHLKEFIATFTEEQKQICDIEVTDKNRKKICVVTRIERENLTLKAYDLIMLNEKNIRNMVDCEENFDEVIRLSNLADDTETKIKAIPEDLFYEVKSLVNRNFKGDWQTYFNTVHLYFSTFTVHKLFVANLFYSSLYLAEDCNEEAQKFKKKLKKLRRNYLFHAAVLLKLIGKGGNKYCSIELFNEFKADKVKEQKFLKNNVLIGTDGKVIPLAQATKTVEKSIGEKMNIIRTMEQIAEDKNWIWSFITLTLPSHMHPNPQNDAQTYDGTSPKDSAIYMNKMVKRVRALMAKRGIRASTNYHGCSSSEAHKDGCIHKHLIFFASSEDMEKIKQCFYDTFDNMNEDSFKIESEENRKKPYIEDGDTYVKGKFRVRASSYVFKYVMKTVNHFDSELDIMSITEEKDPVMYNNMLNNAFRSYNSVRGFSFFGIENCLTKFRFLACNLKKMNLPAMFEMLVQTNNLYELIKDGYFNEIENIYAKVEVKEGEHAKPRFVGCRYNNMNFMKNFFKMVRKAVIKKEFQWDENQPKHMQFGRWKEEMKKEAERKKSSDEAIDVYKKSAMIGEAKYLNSVGLCSLVIVDPNYSRERKKSEKRTISDEIDFRWILEHPSLFIN